MEYTLIAIAHSPQQELQLEVMQRDNDLYFRLLYEGTMLLDYSRLALDPVDKVSDALTLLWTDMRAMPADGVELMTAFAWGDERLLVRFLLTDESLAFRYELEGKAHTSILGERTCFHFGPDANLLVAPGDDGVIDARGLTLPVLLEMDNGLYISVRRTPSLSLPEPSLRLESGQLLEVFYPEKQGVETGDYQMITPWWILAITEP